jgi:uncharacterized protein (TIGR02001 family)
MNFKRIAIAAALGAAATSGTALAELSGNIGVASQYMFRGLEQSKDAAVQGGLDYSAASGFYVGTWASTINFTGVSSTGSGSEVDLYAGFAGEAGAIGYDVGAIYYWYSEEDEPAGPQTGPSNNTVEIYAGVSAGPVGLKLYYSLEDYFALTSKDVFYAVASLGLPISEKLSFGASVGATKADEAIATFNNEKEYLDYSIGLTAAPADGFEMGLNLIGTDLDNDAPKLVLSGGYSFGL